MNILTVNLLLSTLVFWIAARLYILPKLDSVEPRTVLLPILLLHALRHLGLMFLAPGATYPGIPPQFAYPAAFGDLIAGAARSYRDPGGRHPGTHREGPGRPPDPRLFCEHIQRSHGRTAHSSH